jgi:hypothetical protein
MSHATSPGPGRVVLDWRHAAIGPPAPCVLCGKPAICRSPVKGVPCHKRRVARGNLTPGLPQNGA